MSDKVKVVEQKMPWKYYMGNCGEKKKQMKEAESSTLEGNNVENLVKLKNELAGLVIKEE